MSINPVGPDNTGTLTIKFGSGFDAPWFTPKGAPSAITAQVVQAFGLTEEEIAGLAPFEVWGLAASKAGLAWSAKAVESEAGTKPRGGTARPNAGRPNAGRPNAGGAKPAAEKRDEDEDPNAGILAALEAAGSVEDLKKVYGKNISAFEAEQKAGKTVLLDALTARKNALKASA